MRLCLLSLLRSFGSSPALLPLPRLDQLFALRELIEDALARKTPAAHFGSVRDDEERILVQAIADCLDACELRQGDDDKDDGFLFLQKAAPALEVGDAAVQALHDGVADLLAFL